MKKDVAAQISRLMLEYGARLDDSVALVQRTCSPEEFDRYRKATGQIMGEMLLEVMNPIFAEHPDLKPDQLK